MQFETITTEKAQENEKFYTEQLNGCSSVNEVIQVGQIVINLQKQPNGNYLFPKGGSAKFWTLYKTVKQALSEKAEQPKKKRGRPAKQAA